MYASGDNDRSLTIPSVTVELCSLTYETFRVTVFLKELTRSASLREWDLESGCLRFENCVWFLDDHELFLSGSSLKFFVSLRLD